MRRARRELKRSKIYLGRVHRDLQRKLSSRSSEIQHRFAEPMARVARLLAQQRQDKHKLYSLHAPEVECIAKGKVHKKYEFDFKVSLAATHSATTSSSVRSHYPAIPSMAIACKPRSPKSSGSPGGKPNAALSIAVIADMASRTPRCTSPDSSAVSRLHYSVH